MSSESSSQHLTDWTEDLPQTDHVRFFRRVDWACSSLGPLREWGTALRLYTHMVMADSRAATLYWGPDRIAIYNAQFVTVAAKAHPTSMGQPFAQAFPELVQDIDPLFDEAQRCGVAQDVVEAPMMVERSGYREEAFFTGNFTPIRGDNGQIEGFYNHLFEVTTQKVTHRRTEMLNLIATPGDLTTHSVYSHILASLETNSLDIPMAMLYEADAHSESDKTILRLRGHLGIPQGHPLLVDGQDLQSPTGITPLCSQAIVGPVIIACDERFDGVQWRGFNQASHTIVTVALTTGPRLFGFLIIGTNPCRPFDGICEQFVKDVTRITSSLIASALDAEHLRRRQQQLESDLAFSDMKVRHLVEHACVGMAHAQPDGKVIWANEKFFTLAGDASESPDKRHTVDTIYEVFLDEDRQKAEQVWSSIMSGESHVSAELRLKRLFTPPAGDPEPAQIQILAFPYKEDGVTVSGMACTTEISRLKWAEAWQARLAQNARDAKRQQDDYIDAVSHEMRNPLSAIVLCADSIAASLDDVQKKDDVASIPESFLHTLQENASAATIILDCANHQKRIIDDVLTLSRPDSTLPYVTPSTVKPSRLVSSVMSMFEAELRLISITTEVIPEPSISELDVKHLYLDPARVTQIFINLLKNAIKSVKAEEKRKIEVRYGATLSAPRSTGAFPEDFHWAPRGESVADVTVGAEWGSGEVVYLTFMISDTGIGMMQHELANLFERGGN